MCVARIALRVSEIAIAFEHLQANASDRPIQPPCSLQLMSLLQQLASTHTLNTHDYLTLN